MKKLVLCIVVLVLVIGSLLYFIDMDRMKNNEPVVFSTWGKDYTPPAQDNKVVNNDRELSVEEIAKVNEAFKVFIPLENGNVGEEILNPITNFFISYYEKPADMNLENFLMYFTTEDMRSQDRVSETEFLKLKENPKFKFEAETLADMPLPINRKPVDEVNKVLQKYMNITTEDLNTDNIVFLGEPYNAFYDNTSDMGFETFDCISGKIEGNKVYLYSEDAILTLSKTGDNYYIVSHLKK